MIRWWHRVVLNHAQSVNNMITVPAWDPSAKGILIRCACKKTWAL